METGMKVLKNEQLKSKIKTLSTCAIILKTRIVSFPFSLFSSILPSFLALTH